MIFVIVSKTNHVVGHGESEDAYVLGSNYTGQPIRCHPAFNSEADAAAYINTLGWPAGHIIVALELR